MTCGIYKITNVVNGKVYIGRAKNISTRYNAHLSALKRGVHSNTDLQEDFNCLGDSVFGYECIEEVKDHDERVSREWYWVNYYNQETPGLVYNAVVQGDTTFIPAGNYLSQDQVARLFRVDRLEVKQWIDNGILPSILVTSLGYLINAKDLEGFETPKPGPRKK